MTAATNRLSFMIFTLAILIFDESLVECFTVDLIHPDSPQSPFYDPSITKWDRLNGAFRRSSSRAAVLNKLSPKDIQTRIDPVNGAYLMKFYIGNPRVPQFAIVDSGSDLTWFHCKPCKSCSPHHNPTFDPKHSTTYKDIYCDTPFCESVSSHSCDSHNNSNLCRYIIIYADLTFTAGYVGSETFTFESALGPTVSIPGVLFGCGHKNIFNSEGDGVIGLGRGKESFINQASKHITRKFSYCLLPIHSSPNATAKLSFGDSANVESPGAVTIPLKKNDPSYTIKIESIVVNNMTLSLSEEQNSKKENDDIVIDSGTTLTYLPHGLYNKLNSEVQKAIPAKGFESPTGWPLCYKTKDKLIFPKITFKFKGGAMVELLETSTFTQIDPATVCLAILPSDSLGLFGNLAQANSLIGFDLDKNIISFKPMDCTKL